MLSMLIATYWPACIPFVCKRFLSICKISGACVLNMQRFRYTHAYFCHSSSETVSSVVICTSVVTRILLSKYETENPSTTPKTLPLENPRR